MINWTDYPSFSEDEFKCSHTGKVDMKLEFMEKLQELRLMVRVPFIITSGYRDITHPVEAKKDRPGVHTMGIAADIACNGQLSYEIVKCAYLMGFTGIGVSQRGNSRFIHLDTLQGGPRPNMWSY